MARHTLYVFGLKAIASESYKLYANENLVYINAMINLSIKTYNLRGGSPVEQPKVNTTSCGLNISAIRLQNFETIYHLLLKNRLQ